MTYVFFDLDKTLINVQSQRLLLKTLYKRKFISFGELWKLRMFFILYKMHLISNANVSAVFEYAARIFKGIEVEKLKKVVRAFVFAEFAGVRNYRAVEELEKHISAGKEVVLTSSSFDPIVEAAAAFFNIPHFTSTELASKDGLYTGGLKTLPNYGEEKIKRLAPYSFAGSFAYTDHHSDIPLLKKATYRYAVNPTSKLRAYAKANGWFVLE